MIRTKVVATVGPACESELVLGLMIEAGVSVFRLNFSHGTDQAREAALAAIRSAAAERGVTVAVMGDLCGPKIRLGRIEGGKCTLAVGGRVVFRRGVASGTAEGRKDAEARGRGEGEGITVLTSNYPALIDDVSVGDRILIDDGNVLLRVIEKRADLLVAVCEVGGLVSDHKGVNLPDSVVSSPSLTEKDRQDLEWIVRHGLDYVALSFVRQAADLADLREAIRRIDPASRILVVSKIEKPQAIEHLSEIIEASDVVLIARGDLGVEMDVARVPIIQKEIAVECRRAGKPVIVATQMLQSMVSSPVPTRAEVSDVANAILDDADAVMLSAETSVGQYPVQAVRMMRRIAGETEAFTRRFGQPWSATQGHKPPVAKAVIHGASLVAEETDASLVVVWTVDGEAARLLSRHRLRATIIAMAVCEVACRQMALLYGVMPVCVPEVKEAGAMLANLDKILLQRQLAKPGEQLVVVWDARPEVPGETDALAVHTVSSDA